MNRKVRLEILRKIAQAALPTAVPTDAAAKTTVVPGAPPPFKASNFYPGIVVGLQAKNVPWVDGLANILNTALFYSSNGQVSMPWMRQVNFNFSPDQSPSTDLRNIMSFTKQVYNYLFTSLGAGYQQPLTPAQLQQKVHTLQTSQFLSNLASLQPTGQLANKLGGNLKTIITNYLLQIK